MAQERKEENPVLSYDMKPMQIKKEETRLEAQLFGKGLPPNLPRLDKSTKDSYQ